MKKIFLSLVLFLAAMTLVQAQSEAVADYYPNGKLKFKGHTQDGKKVGEWQFFWDTGNVKRQGVYKDGQPTGVWKEFYKGGQIKSEGAFVRGESGPLRHGPWTEYHRNGQPQHEGAYRKGKKVGLWQEFNTLGIPLNKHTY